MSSAFGQLFSIYANALGAFSGPTASTNNAANLVISLPVSYMGSAIPEIILVDVLP